MRRGANYKRDGKRRMVIHNGDFATVDMASDGLMFEHPLSQAEMIKELRLSTLLSAKASANARRFRECAECSQPKSVAGQ
jgi:hypothetical protein